MFLSVSGDGLAPIVTLEVMKFNIMSNLAQVPADELSQPAPIALSGPDSVQPHAVTENVILI